jgi:hypothetical protein
MKVREVPEPTAQATVAFGAFARVCRKSRGGVVTTERDGQGNFVIEGSRGAKAVVPAVTHEEFRQAQQWHRRERDERRRSAAITPIVTLPSPHRPSARPRGAGRPRAHVTRTPSSSSADPGSDDGPAAEPAAASHREAVAR